MTDWFKETAPIFWDEKADHKKKNKYINFYVTQVIYLFQLPVKLGFKSIKSHTGIFPHFAATFIENPKFELYSKFQRFQRQFLWIQWTQSQIYLHYQSLR